MFVLNGIVYANEKSENIQVVSVKPLDDMMMILTFSTGEQRLFDASILTGSAYKPLSDEDIFNSEPHWRNLPEYFYIHFRLFVLRRLSGRSFIHYKILYTIQQTA